MWASPTVVKIVLTAVGSVALLALGGHLNSELISMSALVLPIVVWALNLRQKR